MIRVNKKLKYLFDELPHKYFEEDNYKVRSDKLVYSCHGDETQYIKDLSLNDDNWDLVHLDGHIDNCAANNLELILFDEQTQIDILNKEITMLKNMILEKDNQIRSLQFDCKAKDGKVEYINKQVLYEQNRNKELNKEIKTKEKEIRRLFGLLEFKA